MCRKENQGNVQIEWKARYIWVEHPSADGRSGAAGANRHKKKKTRMTDCLVGVFGTCLVEKQNAGGGETAALGRRGGMRTGCLLLLSTI